MRRPVRRRLKRVIQQSPDANYRRRANALLLLYVRYTKSEAARLLHVARTTPDDWIDRYAADLTLVA
jgi:transposase